MIKFDKTEVMNFEAAIRGARNPMNSHDRSDSFFGCDLAMNHHYRKCDDCDEIEWRECHGADSTYIIGENDMTLLMKLVRAGSDHRKFMRQIFVSVDITAPLYWWKEFDTYKVGTVANSESTMHCIHKKEITLDDFSCERLSMTAKAYLSATVSFLELTRQRFVETKDKSFWDDIIQTLPASYNQKRTISLNYEVLRNMYHARKAHKLSEWLDFCAWIKSLPYSELITTTNEERTQNNDT